MKTTLLSSYRAPLCLCCKHFEVERTVGGKLSESDRCGRPCSEVHMKQWSDSMAFLPHLLSNLLAVVRVLHFEMSVLEARMKELCFLILEKRLRALSRQREILISLQMPKWSLPLYAYRLTFNKMYLRPPPPSSSSTSMHLNFLYLLQYIEKMHFSYLVVNNMRPWGGEGRGSRATEWNEVDYEHERYVALKYKA